MKKGKVVSAIFLVILLFVSANSCISGGDTSSAHTGEHQYTKSETHSETGGYSDTYVFIAWEPTCTPTSSSMA